jgi:hypothetical protein
MVIVVVRMNLMPPKAIGRLTYLRTKRPFGLSKDPRPKKHPKILRKEESKETRDFMKVEVGGVHRNKYNGHCTKQ